MSTWSLFSDVKYIINTLKVSSSHANKATLILILGPHSNLSYHDSFESGLQRVGARVLVEFVRGLKVSTSAVALPCEVKAVRRVGGEKRQYLTRVCAQEVLRPCYLPRFAFPQRRNR